MNTTVGVFTVPEQLKTDVFIEKESVLKILFPGQEYLRAEDIPSQNFRSLRRKHSLQKCCGAAPAAPAGHGLSLRDCCDGVMSGVCVTGRAGLGGPAEVRAEGSSPLPPVLCGGQICPGGTGVCMSVTLQGECQPSRVE